MNIPKSAKIKIRQTINLSNIVIGETSKLLLKSKEVFDKRVLMKLAMVYVDLRYKTDKDSIVKMNKFGGRDFLRSVYDDIKKKSCEVN